MDTKCRTMAKALTWQLIGLFSMTLLGYLVTGSIAEGGTVAASSAVLGTVSYLFHERVWERIKWGRLNA